MASFQSKLNTDVQQYILKFLSDDKSVKAVCKSFKEHIKKNQIRDMRSWRETMVQSQAPFQGTTWIVDPNRDVLTSEEIQNGLKGPCVSLLDARARMESGDKVLLCEGHHEWYSNDENDPHHDFADDECLFIEGIGECYLSFNAQHEHVFFGKLSLSNVHIRYDDTSTYPYTMLLEFVGKNASIYMSDCILDGVKLCVYDHATLNCLRCLFTDKSEQLEIYGEKRSSLTMVDCQIEMNRIPNELVTPDYWDLHVSDDKSNFEAVGGVVKMRLIGCIFSSQNMALNPMTKIQEGIDNRTSTFQYNKYIKSMGSFQSKLSADAQQTILEFLSDDKSVKAVCRPFKRHIKKNQIRDMRSWRETIAQRQPPFAGTTWIVDPNRDVLTAEEILNGFKGPCISLLDARARMEPGDKVVLCEGHHEWYSNDENDPHDAFGEDECLFIEGIGECYLWFNAYHEHGFYGKLSLCNIQIRYDNPSPYPYTMLLEFFDSACIFMTDCVLDAVKICMYHDSTLNCIRCSFTDKSEQFLICGEHRSSLTMVDCQIEMNRIPNEVVTSDYWDLHVSDDKSKFESLGGAVTMQLIGCIFSSQNLALNPMTKIQEGIDKRTSTFQYNKYIKSRQASLQSKLSADAQQTILQFLSGDKSVKAVSKSFKEHIKKNEIRDMRSWRTTVAQRQPPFKGTTWIVDPNRNVLTAEENQNGFRGPCISLLDARARMESGDKVLLCEGHHEWYSNEANDPHDSFGDDECVYIEGIGECYIWFNAQHEHRFYGKLSFSNVHIRHADISPYPYSMLLEIHGEGASVFMSDCILDGVKLCVYDQATLNCIRCSFTDKSEQLEIYGEKRSSLTMVDCQIEMNRIPNKVVTPDYWNLHESDDKSNFEANGGAVTMRLIGCIFSSQNMALNPMTKIQEGIDKRTSTFQYNKYIKSR